MDLDKKETNDLNPIITPNYFLVRYSVELQTIVQGERIQIKFSSLSWSKWAKNSGNSRKLKVIEQNTKEKRK